MLLIVVSNCRRAVVYRCAICAATPWAAARRRRDWCGWRMLQRKGCVDLPPRLPRLLCGVTDSARLPRPSPLQLCRDRGYPFVRLDGSTTIKKRNKLVGLLSCRLAALLPGGLAALLHAARVPSAPAALPSLQVVMPPQP